MFTSLPRAALAALPLLMATACATSLPPVEVTRFHETQVTRGGTIRLVPEEGGEATSLEYRTFASAVAESLTRAGFTVVDGSSASLVARIGMDRSVDRPIDTRGSPVSVGVGGSTGRYGSGLGLGLGINLSGPPKAVIGTQLRVQIRRADSNAAVWEGRAETAAKENSPAAQTGIAAGKLADALFRDYPGESGATIRVK